MLNLNGAKDYTPKSFYYIMVKKGSSKFTDIACDSTM